MSSSQNYRPCQRWRKKLPKSKKSPYDVQVKCSVTKHWTPGSETPSLCPHTALECSKRLCASISKDLILPPQVFLHTKGGRRRYNDKRQQILTCPHLLINSSSSSSDISTDSGITDSTSSQGKLIYSQELTAPSFTIPGSVSTPFIRAKSCPPATSTSSHHRSSGNYRSSTEHSVSAVKNTKTLQTKRSPTSTPMSDLHLPDKSLTSLSQSKHQHRSSAYSSSVVLQSKFSTPASMVRPSSAACIHSAHSSSLSSNSTENVFDRLSKPKLPVTKNNQQDVATSRPSSAMSSHAGFRYRLSTDCTDDVFIRLSRPKQSTSGNNQTEISPKRHSVSIGMELFERLSMPKIVPKPHVDMSSKRRHSRPVDSELFDRLAQPKSRSSRSLSVFSHSLDAPLPRHFSTRSDAGHSSRRSSLLNPKSRSLRSSSLFSQSVDPSGLTDSKSFNVSLSSRRLTMPQVSRWNQSFGQSPPCFAGTLTTDPILEVNEGGRSRSVSVSSLNAFDVTQEASALLSNFNERTDSLDELQLLSLEDVNEDEDVFLSSMDSQTSRLLSTEGICEKEFQPGDGEDFDLQLETRDKAGTQDNDIEGILKSAEMLLHSQDMEPQDNHQVLIGIHDNNTDT